MELPPPGSELTLVVTEHRVPKRGELYIDQYRKIQRMRRNIAVNACPILVEKWMHSQPRLTEGEN